LKEYHFYISDDRCHELAYVQHFFQLFYNHLKEKKLGSTLDLVRWLCGPVKKCSCISMVVYVAQKIKVPHIGNYFKSGNGKWEHYGADECIKKHYMGKKSSSQLLPSFEIHNPLLNGVLQ
jgi:hypothetical protein